MPTTNRQILARHVSSQLGAFTTQGGRLTLSEFEAMVRKAGQVPASTLSSAAVKRLFRAVATQGLQGRTLGLEELTTFVWGVPLGGAESASTSGTAAAPSLLMAEAAAVASSSVFHDHQPAALEQQQLLLESEAEQTRVATLHVLDETRSELESLAHRHSAAERNNSVLGATVANLEASLSQTHAELAAVNGEVGLAHAEASTLRKALRQRTAAWEDSRTIGHCGTLLQAWHAEVSSCVHLDTDFQQPPSTA